MSSKWLELLRAERELIPAKDLYMGRAFLVTRSAAERAEASLGILSAGLGFVRGDVDVPGYDLTVSPGKPGSVPNRVLGTFSPTAWWRSVQRGPFATDLRATIEAHDIALVALSKAYLDLIVDDLLAVEASTPGRLRLFGLSLNRHLPAELAASFMPYDARLEGLGGAGTRTDFAARALDDFTRHCDFREDAATHADTVARRLTGAQAPAPRPLQRRADDDSVRSAIRTFFKGGPRNSSRALAWLRNVQGLSCEQKRFANLFKEVALEKSA